MAADGVSLMAIGSLNAAAWAMHSRTKCRQTSIEKTIAASPMRNISGRASQLGTAAPFDPLRPRGARIYSPRRGPRGAGHRQASLRLYRRRSFALGDAHAAKADFCAGRGVPAVKE
jgi:hypothetical protein